jgi:hypothetical protein
VRQILAISNFLALLELRLLLGTIGLVWPPMFLSYTKFEISEECEDFTYLPMCFGPRVPQSGTFKTEILREYLI